MIARAATASSAARSLLQAAGREAGQHTILQENLTDLLSNFKPNFVASLQEAPAATRLEALNGSYANGPLNLCLKISREIRQKPYTDESALSRLDRLETALQGVTSQVLEGNPGYPCRFYVCGSLLKGRFGANSDLDLLVAASPEWMHKNFWEVGRREDVSIQCLQGNPEQQAAKLASFGKTLEVDPDQLRQPGFLHGLWNQSIQQKGFELRDGHLAQVAPTILRQPEVDLGWGTGGMV
jgi:hypothetical protein